MSEPLLVISCGGTFDKSRFTRAGKFVCGEPQAGRILAAAGVDETRCRVSSLLRKDSLDMDDADRRLVADAVAQAAEQRVVIVHGTDTLVDTARTLIGIAPAKTVVVAGAMRPAVFTDSDADLNLGFALGAAVCQPAGVWVAMHGRIWTADKVRKDTEDMRFVDA